MFNVLAFTFPVFFTVVGVVGLLAGIVLAGVVEMIVVAVPVWSVECCCLLRQISDPFCTLLTYFSLVQDHITTKVKESQ